MNGINKYPNVRGVLITNLLTTDVRDKSKIYIENVTEDFLKLYGMKEFHCKRFMRHKNKLIIQYSEEQTAKYIERKDNDDKLKLNIYNRIFEIIPVELRKILFDLLPLEIVEKLLSSRFFHEYFAPFLKAFIEHTRKSIFKEKQEEYVLTTYKEPLFNEDTSLEHCYNWWLQLSQQGYLSDSNETERPELKASIEESGFVKSPLWIVIPSIERFNQIIKKKNFRLNLELHLLIVIINQVLRILNNYIKYKGHNHGSYLKKFQKEKERLKKLSPDDLYKETIKQKLTLQCERYEIQKYKTSIIMSLLEKIENSGNHESFALEQFSDFLNKIDILIETRQFQNYHDCLISHNEWYGERIHKGYKNQSYKHSSTYYYLDNAEPNFEKNYKYALNYMKKSSNDSPLPVAFFPTTFHYNFKNFLKQYVCGISIYITAYSEPEKAVHEGFFHPITHIAHNVLAHHGLIKGGEMFQTLLSDYNKLKTFDDYQKYLTMKKELIHAVYEHDNSEILCKILFNMFHESGLSLIYQAISKTYSSIDLHHYYEWVPDSLEKEREELTRRGKKQTYTNLIYEYYEKIATLSKCKKFRDYFRTPEDLNKVAISYNPILIYIILDKFNRYYYAYYRIIRSYKKELKLEGEIEDIPLDNYLTQLKDLIKDIYNMEEEQRQSLNKPKYYPYKDNYYEYIQSIEDFLFEAKLTVYSNMEEINQNNRLRLKISFPITKFVTIDITDMTKIYLKDVTKKFLIGYGMLEGHINRFLKHRDRLTDFPEHSNRMNNQNVNQLIQQFLKVIKKANVEETGKNVNVEATNLVEANNVNTSIQTINPIEGTGIITYFGAKEEHKELIEKVSKNFNKTEIKKLNDDISILNN